MKFGGTSVADISKIKIIAQIIKDELSKGNEIIAVVSAMAGKTNNLTEKVESIGPLYDAREYSAIVSTGENVRLAYWPSFFKKCQLTHVAGKVGNCR